MARVSLPRPGRRAAQVALGVLLFGLCREASALPLVIAVAASAAGSAIAAALTLTGIWASAFTAGFSFLVQGLFGRESQSTPDTGQGAFANEARGRQDMIRSNVEPRKIIYGEVLTSGALVFARTSGASSGNPNGDLDLVLVLAGHPCQSIGEIYLNDEPVGPLGDDGGEGEGALSGRYARRVHVRKYLGTQTAADAGLMARHPSKWTAQHVGYGLTYLVIRLTFDRDVFPQGIPNVKALVRGKKVYDPRTGATVYSNNWALCVRDYLTASYLEGGIQAGTDELDDTALTAAANICDERVAMAAYTATATASAATGRFTYTADELRIASGDEVTLTTDGALPAPLTAGTSYYAIRHDATTVSLASSVANALAGTAVTLTTDGNGTHTLSHVSQARYTLNGVIDTSKTPLSILPGLTTAAAGTVTYPNGQFRVFAGAYDTPVLTLDEDDLRGPIELVAAPPRRELYNAVKGTYIDPGKAWQPGDFPPVRNTTYVTQDNGEEVFRDVELPYTTDSVRAQRLAKIVLEKSRQGMTLSMPVNLRGFQIATWDTVLVNNSAFGFSSKVFRVTGWKLAENGLGVDLTLREESAASYDWAAGEATVTDPAPDTELPNALDVAVPGNPTVTETLYETTGSAGLKTRADVTWSASADAFVIRYEAQYKPAAGGSDAWVAMASVSLLNAQVADIAPGDYVFRVRALNTLGVRSAWSAEVPKEIRGLTALPGNVASLAVIASGGFALGTWDLTTDLDVRLGGRVVVRHSPLTSGAAWENGVTLREFSGDAVSGLLPLITGTYMAKFRDSTDHYSETAASFVATEGMVTGLSTLSTITESTGFAGTKTNVVVSSLTLKLDTVGLIDAAADFDAIADLDALGTISPTGTYEFATVYDGATKAVRRFEADIAVTASDTGDLIDARDEVDNWGSVDGATVNDCDVTLYAATTDDNPAGSPTWGAWTPFMVADFNCRAAKFKLEFASGAPTHNIAVSTLAVAIKA